MNCKYCDKLFLNDDDGEVGLMFHKIVSHDQQLVNEVSEC